MGFPVYLTFMLVPAATSPQAPSLLSRIGEFSGTITGILAIGTALVGLLGFFHDRKKEREERSRESKRRDEELRWRRTEFLFRLAKEFDEDPKTQECFHLLDYPELVGSLNGTTVDRILRVGPSRFSPEEIQTRSNVEHVLRFFSRLAYCEGRGTLTLEEIEQYAWYLKKIHTIPALQSYCDEYGFSDVEDLATKILEHQLAKEWRSKHLEGPPPTLEEFEKFNPESMPKAQGPPAIPAPSIVDAAV